MPLLSYCVLAAFVAAVLQPPPKTETPVTPDQLVSACENGDMERIESLIAAGVDVNAPASGMSRRRPLFAAAEGRQYDALARLLEAGANPNATNYIGVAPLHVSSARGPIESVEALLAAGAHPNAFCTQRDTPLAVAAGAGRVDIANALIAAGAMIEGNQTGRGLTPLAKAAKYDKIEMIGVLMTLGADPDGGTSPPLHWAGSPEAVVALLDHGADPNVRDDKGRTPLHLTSGYWVPKPDAVSVLIDAGANSNARDNEGATPLHQAIRHQSAEIISLLIAAGADPNAIDGEGNTPLSLARKAGPEFVAILTAGGATDDGRPELQRAVEAGNIKDVRALIADGVDVDETGPGGITAAHLASQAGRADILDALIEAGARIGTGNHTGTAPIHFAVTAAIVHRLVAAGAEVNARDIHETTPLFAAIEAGHADVARALVEHGATFDGPQGSDPLVWSCFFGRHEIVDLLLKHEVDPDSRVYAGMETGLHVAVRGGLFDMNSPEHVTPVIRMKIARSLISAGADIEARATIGYFDGLTPMHSAVMSDDLDAVNLLLANGANINAHTDSSSYNGVQTPLDLARTNEMRTYLKQQGGTTADVRP